MLETSGSSSPNHRLNSWKEIAAFHSRDERTVKRWEKQRGLPVHRLPGSGHSVVFAYESELVDWLAGHTASRTPDAQSDAAAADAQSHAVAATDAQSHPPPADAPEGPPAAFASIAIEQVSPRKHFWSASALLALLAIGCTVFLAPAKQPSIAPQSAKSALRKPDPDVEDLYLKGTYHWHKRTPADLNEAIEDFHRAIMADPDYAQAYAGLADCYNLLSQYSMMPPEQAFPLAKAAAEHAIQLDDRLSDAHSALAFVDFYWSWDIPAAQREFRRAFELDPNSVPARHWNATFLAYTGDLPQASAQIEIARSLDPDSRAILADKAIILLAAGRKRESIALLKELESAEPDFLSPHTYLANIYLATSDSADYLAELERSAQLLKGQRQLALLRAARRGFSSGGRQGMLDAMLQEQRARYVQGRESAYAVAQTSALAGDNQQALEYLSRGCHSGGGRGFCRALSY